MAINIGQVLQERYRIDALLGKGGMGAVYRGTDLTFGTAVAVKENQLSTPEAQKQFAREAGLLHQLRHPNLPRVSDHFSIPGHGQYLVMDYIDGQDLGQIIAQQGAISEAQAQAWIGQVLDALEYLHRQRIVHRDIKPANIRITPEGQVFLVDFGLAKVCAPLVSTTIGARGVTPGFAPPEQYGGAGRTDARSDLYSIGATLYAMLTGQPPPDGVDLMVGHATLSPPRHLNPAISPHVEAAILKAMQSRPTDRPQAVAELRAALALPPAVGRPRPAAGPAGRRPPAARPRRAALPVWLLVGGSAAFLLVMVIVVGVLLIGDEQGGAKVTPETPRTAVAAAALTRTTVPEFTPSSTTLSGPLAATSMPSATSGPPAATSMPSATSSPSTDAPTPTVTTRPVKTASPPAAAPTGGSRIAFHSDRAGNDEIFVMNTDGSGLVRLTNNPAADTAPAWSPDGTHIAFTSDRAGNGEIHVMNADGSGLTRLTNNPAGDWASAWSPDGSRIAFTSDRDGNWEIYVMNADGSGLTRLTDNPAEDFSSAWSPDSTRIAFSSFRDGNLEIYVVTADGSGLTRLTNNPAEDWASAWSPDGSRIAFMSDSGGGDWDIYVMNADGSGLTRLTDPPGLDGAPDWSPDGKRIAFHSKREGNAEIYVMNADGSGQTRLTTNPASDEGAAWSP